MMKAAKNSKTKGVWSSGDAFIVTLETRSHLHFTPANHAPVSVPRSHGRVIWEYILDDAVDDDAAADMPPTREHGLELIADSTDNAYLL